MRLGRVFKLPALIEHEVTESRTTSGDSTHYYCSLAIGEGGYKSRVVSAISHVSQQDANQKAYEEFGKMIDQYLRVYDRLTEEMRRENAG